MQLSAILPTFESVKQQLTELSHDTMKSYRKLAIADAMKKHHAGGASNEIEACKRAKNIARSVRIEMKRRNDISEAVMDMPLDAAKARLADLQHFLANVPRNLSSQEQYDEVDDARDEVRELTAYINGKPVQESAATASAAYENRSKQCQELLSKIGQYLSSHNQQQQTNPDSWSWAGDLAYVAEQLSEIWEFLSSGDDQKPTSESVQLDELSKTTLQSYVIKRAQKHGERQYQRANGDAFALDDRNNISRDSANRYDQAERKAERKALRGIQHATSKLADASYGRGSENEEQSEFSPQFIQGVARGEIDLQDALGQNTMDGRALTRLIDVIAAQNKLNKSRDFDEILDLASEHIMGLFGNSSGSSIFSRT